MSIHQTQTYLHIRWLIHRDYAEVLEIEKLSFDSRWTQDDFLRCLRRRDCIGMVAEHEDKVVGFMIYELHKKKLHILNFAVHPRWRRMQVGAQMARKLIGKLASHRRRRITLAVRETNLIAQLFFQSQGFWATNVKRTFYEDSGEDAFVMEYCLRDDGDQEDEEECINEYED